MRPSLFIGLVTHPKSRYAHATGPTGLMASLTEEMRSSGWDVTCSVAADNRIDDTQINLSREAVLASIHAELEAERQWRQFQTSAPPNAKDSVVLALRKHFRRWKFARRSEQSATAGRAMLMRLANIEASHVRLLHEAAESGAQWVLILEDDAFTTNVTELAHALNRHLTEWDTATQPKFINISRSFPLAQLHLRQALTDEGAWDSSARILGAAAPFTNTVCAIVYRGGFLADLNRELDAIPMQPVVPIDWKLNLAIMQAAAKGQLKAGDCYVIDPAPVLQGSMHRPNSELTGG